MATVAELTAQLSEWESALSALATGKSYQIGTRQLTRANAKEVRDTIDWLERKIARAGASQTGNLGHIVFEEPL